MAGGKIERRATHCGANPVRWEEFRRCYEAELEVHPEEMRWLRERARTGRLRLYYGARDLGHNQTVVLRDDLLCKARKCS